VGNRVSTYTMYMVWCMYQEGSKYGGCTKRAASRSTRATVEEEEASIFICADCTLSRMRAKVVSRPTRTAFTTIPPPPSTTTEPAETCNEARNQFPHGQPSPCGSCLPPVHISRLSHHSRFISLLSQSPSPKPPVDARDPGPASSKSTPNFRADLWPGGGDAPGDHRDVRRTRRRDPVDEETIRFTRRTRRGNAPGGQMHPARTLHPFLARCVSSPVSSPGVSPRPVYLLAPCLSYIFRNPSSDL